MRKFLFLYLAIACFLGLVVIFITDGYMGIYDTVDITVGERPETIEPDFWLRRDRVWSTRTNWGEPVHFSYEIDNRRVSSYSTPIQAAVWKGNNKVSDLFYEDKVIEPFSKVTVEWALDTKTLEPYQDNIIKSEEYTVKIKTDNAERRIILHLISDQNPLVVPPPMKVPPPVPPPR
ncbi:hypothetical protein ACFLTZ_06480 [Chloroflexota bacterium]